MESEKRRVKKSRRKKSRAKKIAFIVAGVLGMMLLLGGGLVAYLYNQVDSTVNRINESSGLSKERMNQKTIAEKKPISVLLLGVDRRADEQGRSDSIIVMTLNPNKDQSAMLSIPRDTKTEIVGKGVADKINHAYAFGGAEMALDTVENFLGIPIDYVAEVDMKGFQDAVDLFGGVEVTNDLAFESGGYTFNPGVQTLNGAEALAFTRMRYDDPRGDFGRQERQRAVITAIVNEGVNDFSLSKFTNMLDVLGNNAKTNITFKELRTLSTEYTAAFKNQDVLRLEGQGGKEGDGIYYWRPSSTSLGEVRSYLAELMEQ
ncbi:LCP family glycopolymer transferase [Exiguobacterium aurantiacum]|uniref:LCP family protein n=2 Tax=Exiguobacterium TaxID=33986 RepID=A0ABY5FPH2_9BACL|nr:LCP family protein [Exiguobacterium aurantiacum]UTT43505.1 LCP family protein [Exiguobacterium aurantiacum]